MSEQDYQEILEDLPRRRKVWAAIADLDYGLSGLEYVLRTCRESGYSWAELDRINRYEVVPATQLSWTFFYIIPGTMYGQFYNEEWLFERIPRLVRRRHHERIVKFQSLYCGNVTEDYWREVEWRFKGCDGKADPDASLRLRYAQQLKKMSDESLAAMRSGQISGPDAWRQAHETRYAIMKEARSHKPIEIQIFYHDGFPNPAIPLRNFIKWWNLRFNPPGAFCEERKYIVQTNNKGINLTWPYGDDLKFRWDAVQSISIETRENGPFDTDFHWALNAGEKRYTWPYGAIGDTQAIEEMFSRFPDFDNEALLKAYGCTEWIDFICWER